MPGGCYIFYNIYYPDYKGQRHKKAKPLGARPCHSLSHWSQMEPRNRPISALPGANQFLYSCTLVSSSLGRLHGHRESEIPLPWQDKMKEDGQAVRLLDRHSREPALWMVMDCLYARLSPCLILFTLWLPGCCTSLQGHRGLVGEASIPQELLVVARRSNHSGSSGNKHNS